MTKYSSKLIENSITAKEVFQQPALWEETYSIYKENRLEINDYLKKISDKFEKVRLILTGAGTSAYVGKTITPFLMERMGSNWSVENIPTTSLVSNPNQYYDKDIPTVLVSFARSGNSPESIAAVDLGKSIIDEFYQVTITCAADGELAKSSKYDEKNFLLLMPERSNDQGFAMTGSYTCMTLTGLLVFGGLGVDQEDLYVEKIITSGNNMLNRAEEVNDIIKTGFKRIIYLGSGSLEGLAQESQLKVLELTAGQLSVSYESPLGFRHGPKSFVDDSTLIVTFVSNNKYTKQYDLDMVKELTLDEIAKMVVTLKVEDTVDTEEPAIILDSEAEVLPDAFLGLPYVLFSQMIALYSSVHLGHNPDNPSPSGTVNRVVKGVTIYNYE